MDNIFSKSYGKGAKMLLDINVTFIKIVSKIMKLSEVTQLGFVVIVQHNS